MNNITSRRLDAEKNLYISEDLIKKNQHIKTLYFNLEHVLAIFPSWEHLYPGLNNTSVHETV